MADIVSAKTRSRMMADIKGKNTKPDLIFPKYKAVIFVNGCFWHKHGCALFKWPKSNVEFWREKFTANVERDKRNHAKLAEDGWNIKIIWECALKSKLE